MCLYIRGVLAQTDTTYCYCNSNTITKNNDTARRYTEHRMVLSSVGVAVVAIYILYTYTHFNILNVSFNTNVSHYLY